MKDFQLWCDLRAFEQRLGCRYLTHEGDEVQWRRFAQERALLFRAAPRAAPSDPLLFRLLKLLKLLNGSFLDWSLLCEYKLEFI